MPNRLSGSLTLVVTAGLAGTEHRQVVWSAMLPPGRHFIRVVNVATAGHPRIDLDAILR